MNCRICHSSNIEKIFSLQSYPIFIGCTNQKIEEDQLYNFEIWHCKDCDIGQQITPPPFDELYKEQRCFGFGQVWQDHYEKYFEFIKKNTTLNSICLEVGVGNAIVYKKMIQYVQKVYGIDPIYNPEYDNYDIVVDTFSDNKFEEQFFDFIYSSHLIEHLPDPSDYLRICNKLLKDGGMCFLATPNILKSFENLHFNAFTADHLNYFTKDSLTNLAISQGFELVDFYQYLDHGMYLALKKTKNNISQINNKSFRKFFDHYHSQLEKFIDKVKIEIVNTQSIYLFGAHGLTVTFLKLLDSKKFESKVKFVLDNEQTKHDRRLSGTNIICKPTSIIAYERNPIIILYMGAYENEISDQLRGINSSCNIIRSRG